MLIHFTDQVQLALVKIADYLFEQRLPHDFVKRNLTQLKQSIENILVTFPESGKWLEIDDI